MATLDAETLDALNALLEDARASVEIELALTNGATELREREVLDAMGGEEVLTCCALRERLTLAGAPVTWRINGIVFHILGTERYDERLRAFARHQAAICERAEALLTTISDREAHRLLRELYDSHAQSARWAEQRANSFAATRLLDFTLPRATRLATAGLRIEREPGPDAGANGVEALNHGPEREAAIQPEPGAALDGTATEAPSAIDIIAAHMEHPQLEPDRHNGRDAGEHDTSESSDDHERHTARDDAAPDE